MSTTISLTNNTTVTAAAPIDATVTPSLKQSLELAQAQLQKFASNPEFSQKLAVAFGDGANLQALQADWLAGDFSILSGIEIRTSAELNRAKGAYSAATDTIYLSQEFWDANQDNPEILVGVLLEEVGHRIDARVNTVDSLGDEGEIFSRIVQSIDTSAEQIESIHANDDHAIIMLDGREIAIEEAGDLITKAQVAELKDGINQVFTALNSALGAKVFAEQLPFLGDNLKDAFDGGDKAFQYLKTFRDAVNKGLDTLASINTDPTTDQVKTAINTALTTAGIQGLGGLVNLVGNDVKIDFKLLNPTLSAVVDLSGDFGLPNLGLKTTGKAQTILGYNFNFDVGVDSTGFYFDTAPTGSNLGIKLATTIPNFSAKADLSLLNFTASDNSAKPSSFIANFDVGFKDSNGDNKLRLNELGNVASLIDAKLTADANINLKLQSALSVDIPLPTFSTNLNVAWKFNSAAVDPGDDNKTFGNAPTISLNDSSLNLGSFFSTLPGQVLKQIQEITKPIQPIIDILTAEIPLITELSGKVTTLLDLIGATPDEVAAIKGLADIVTLANTVASFSGDNGVSIDLGSLTLDTDVRSSVLTDAVATVTRALTPSTNKNATKFLADSKAVGGNGGLSFPILTDEKAIGKLLLGQNVDLFKYQPKPISLSAEYTKFFPVLGPIGIKLGGKVGFALKLDVGYDTKGLRDFLASQTKDPTTVFNGFYLDAFDDQGNILTGGQLQAGVIAGVAVNLGIVEVAVEGDLTATVDFGFNSKITEADGKVRGAKLLATKLEDLFELSGELTAGLRAYLDLGIGPISYRALDLESPRVTLLSFNKDKQLPILGTVLADGTLRLNMGPNSADRLHGNVSDGPENFTIKGSSDTGGPVIEVGAFKVANYFRTSGITKIVANGAERADVIAADDSVSVDVVFSGGANDDSLSGGKIADILNGDGGNDLLNGNGGNDTLKGGAGKDVLIGGSGADVLDGGDDFDIADYQSATAGLTIDLTTPQNSTGDAFGDTYTSIEGIKGSKFDDKLTGNDNDNALLEGFEGNDLIQGLGGIDILYGGIGNDTLEGGLGDDFLTGSVGADALDGGGGIDATTYIQSKSPVNVSLKTGIGTGGDAQGDTLTNIEILVGSITPSFQDRINLKIPPNKGDVLEGNDEVNIISGLAGNDYISGLGGDDSLYGETADP
jgi:Ca2+-binding RTX toxin-like protein